MIAFVKDTLVYVTVIVAILYIPTRIGGWGHIFGAAAAHLKTINPDDRKTTRRPHPDARPASGPSPPSRSARRWRCSCTRTSITGVLATKRRDVVRRNLAALPAYTLCSA